MKNLIISTDDEMKFILAQATLFENLIPENVRSIYHDCENCLMTISFLKKMNLILKLYASRFHSFQMPSGVYQMVDFNPNRTDLFKINVNTDDATLKTSLIT